MSLALTDLPQTTDGEIFVRNMESVLERHWFMHHVYPDRAGTLEALIDAESLRAQFFGDYSALDRMVKLVEIALINHSQSAATHIAAAQVDSVRHLFASALDHINQADVLGADQQLIKRLRLSIEQALGKNLEAVLAQRQSLASVSHSIQDLIPLGALLAEQGCYEEANAVYLKAIESYQDLSPLGLAWTCFQLGMLWGEVHDQPDLDRAAHWYAQAVAYLPGYTHACVHLAEIYIDRKEYSQARTLLLSVFNSGDPEVRWRMADLFIAEDKFGLANDELAIATSMYESLLSRHELAFADHAAEFYLGSGTQPARAYELALANLHNRPTWRAYELAHHAAIANNLLEFATGLSQNALHRWGKAL
jgi:Tfp pilus assembly protein PilF